MAGRPRRVSDEVIAEVIREHYGVLAHAARALGMRTDALHHRVLRSSALQAAVHEARRSVAVKAFEKFREHLDRGEPWAIQYAMRWCGSYIGYGPPMVHIPRGSDPYDVLQRLDQLESELAGYPITIRDALTLLEFRRAVVADILRSENIPDLDALITEVTNALETAIPDPELRARVTSALVQAFQRAAGRAAGS